MSRKRKDLPLYKYGNREYEYLPENSLLLEKAQERVFGPVRQIFSEIIQTQFHELNLDGWIKELSIVVSEYGFEITYQPILLNSFDYSKEFPTLPHPNKKSYQPLLDWYIPRLHDNIEQGVQIVQFGPSKQFWAIQYTWEDDTSCVQIYNPFIQERKLMQITLVGECVLNVNENNELECLYSDVMIEPMTGPFVITKHQSDLSHINAPLPMAFPHKQKT